MKTSKFIITAALVILPPIAAYGQTPPEPHISGEVYGHEYADLGLPSKPYGQHATWAPKDKAI